MKKVFIGIALLAIVTINLINVTPELINSSNFSLSMAQAWEPENPELWSGYGDVGQTTFTGYCVTSECVLWSDDPEAKLLGYFWYSEDGEPICVDRQTVQDWGTWCTDNYVCPTCTCSGGDDCDYDYY